MRKKLKFRVPSPSLLGCHMLMVPNVIITKFGNLHIYVLQIIVFFRGNYLIGEKKVGEKFRQEKI